MNGVRIVGRLQFSFAVLTCLGGLVLASGTNNDVIPAIAIFFFIFGFLFVDWMRMFSLPPVAAYAAMGLASLYCIANFLETDQPGNHQMISVSQLLVCVQAVLMLQRKTIRIYEQLAVFCLLELVVAAVFNDALNYGLLLIPVCITGLWALTLLAIATSINSVDGAFSRLLGESDRPEKKAKQGRAGLIQFRAPESVDLMANVGVRLPSWVMFSFAPGVLVVATFFFYALPRTTDASRVSDRGMAVVGFNDEVRLEQLGQMGKNGQVAARIALRRRPGNRPFQPISGLFLRGAVLERYRVDRTADSSNKSGRNSSIWSAVGGSSAARGGPMPPEFFSVNAYGDSSNDLLSGSISVEVTYEASRSSSLFAIPPYYSTEKNSDILHRGDRWTMLRDSNNKAYYPRIKYVFGTHAFSSGVQCEAIVSGLTMDLLAIDLRSSERAGYSDHLAQAEASLSGTIKRKLAKADAEKRWAMYKEQTLAFDRGAMPTIKKIADQIRHSSNSGNGKSTDLRSADGYALAKALEQHFFVDQRYQYSLNLNAESVIGMDPIEQFVAVDRVGHCQYFASALAMMLRSQGIPSRIIVGYKTDEYSEIGDHFVARQSHAHAWVEALINRDDLDARRIGGGQPRSDKYWVRLDPTPSSFLGNDEPSNASKVMYLAQDIWDGMIIDMDSENQVRALSNKGGSSALSQSYSQFVSRVSGAVARIRAGKLGGGALADYDRFSLQAAAFGITIALSLVLIGLLVRWKPPGWVRKSLGMVPASTAARPSIDFYADTIDQLKRVGIERSSAQTPRELLASSRSYVSKPLEVLTSAFYQVRYRGKTLSVAQSSPSKSDVDEALEDLTRRVDAIRNGDDTAGRKNPTENL